MASPEQNTVAMHAWSPGQAEFHLFYNDHCRACRVLSRLVVIISLGAIRRVPLDSVETEDLRRGRPEWRGELMLVHGDRVWLAERVYHAVPLAIMSIYWRRLRRLVFFR